MTYRDRREAKAERLREWAAKREQSSTANALRASEMASVIPFGQPILVGHHSERRDRNYRDRIGRTMDRAIEDERKAESMTSRASNIEAQLNQSIYSDDPDAIEQLEARIEKLEAERERYKAHNKATRGERGCTHPPECACRSKYEVTRCGCREHPLPSYVLTNLSGNIKRNRDRLEALKIKQRRAERCENAGGLIVEPAGSGYVCVTFAEKPAREILDALKGAGFFWRRGSWFGKADALPEAVQNA